jgi:2-dehydro-3-deoxy-D-arabinonate dehydratase
MILYRTRRGAVVEHDGRWFSADATWDELFNDDALPARLARVVASVRPLDEPISLDCDVLAPLESQEIWAAGVTYLRSRTARMEESATAGGGGFYDRVYHADRPELFFKATAHRAVGHGQNLRLRSDSKWMVPEPELTLAITRSGKIVGYTIGNDLSCRDIEGENPLYLPQAKTFDRCAAVGPGILVSADPISPDAEIRLEITRDGQTVFSGATAVSQMKKTLPALASYLYRDNTFPHGALLMTGTGIVPDDNFTLASGDQIRIAIAGIGALVNGVE